MQRLELKGGINSPSIAQVRVAISIHLQPQEHQISEPPKSPDLLPHPPKVEKGFNPQHDSDNYTNREVVDAELNATALHMIQQAVKEKDFPFIMKHTITNDAWDSLAELYIANESMRHNKYIALKNQAEGFMKKQNEDHQDMYARLITVAAAFRNVGALYIDDKWIKEKYVEALWPYEPQDLKTLKGRPSYYDMSSHGLMQELQSFEVAEKNANDALKRAMRTAKG